MRKLAAVLAVSIVVLLSAYVGIWLCFIGGIVSVVEAFKATPVNSLGLALGLLRFLLTSAAIAAGWASAVFIGVLLWPRRR